MSGYDRFTVGTHDDERVVLAMPRNEDDDDERGMLTKAKFSGQRGQAFEDWADGRRTWERVTESDQNTPSHGRARQGGVRVVAYGGRARVAAAIFVT